MQKQTQTETFCWDKEYRSQHRWKTAGVISFLVVRFLFGAYFFFAACNKLVKGWMWSNTLRKHFLQRLSELEPNSFQAVYLRRFAIPLYGPIAWFLVLGQATVGLGMMTGTAVRPNGVLALFMLFNIGAGGYANPSIAPFMMDAVLLTALPSGQWWGLDKKLRERYPQAIWFR
jgi:thiosulfate dehydrogenase (quinone) large subunit